MNAVERLWRALGEGDWTAMTAQLGPGAEIERPGDAALPAAEYVAWHRAAGAPDAIRRRRTVGDGTIFALEATVDRGGERFRVVALYDLHDARIRGGTEVWAPGG